MVKRLLVGDQEVDVAFRAIRRYRTSDVHKYRKMITSVADDRTSIHRRKRRNPKGCKRTKLAEVNSDFRLAARLTHRHLHDRN